MRIARLPNESGLRQIELARNRLHAGAIQRVGIEHDGGRVALQGRLGEHVDDGVAKLGHAAERFCSRKFRITSSPALVWKRPNPMRKRSGGVGVRLER